MVLDLDIPVFLAVRPAEKHLHVTGALLDERGEIGITQADGDAADDVGGLKCVAPCSGSACVELPIDRRRSLLFLGHSGLLCGSFDSAGSRTCQAEESIASNNPSWSAETPTPGSIDRELYHVQS